MTKRMDHALAFKAKGALTALSGHKTVAEMENESLPQPVPANHIDPHDLLSQ